MATEFTVFPQLITELRLEIWRLSLPAPFRRPLYPYQKGCWTPRYLTEADQDFQPDGDNLYMEFDPSGLEPLQIELPLYSVNREARSVTQEYIRKQNLSARRVDGKPIEFIRRFDPGTDTVLLSSADIDDFLREPLERLSEPDLLDRNVSFSNPALPRLAVTPSALLDLREDLGDFFNTAGTILTLYVVDASLNGTRRVLELGEASRARFVWRTSQREWETAGDDEAVLLKMRGLVAGLDYQLAMSWEFDLEVLLVDLVTR